MITSLFLFSVCCSNAEVAGIATGTTMVLQGGQYPNAINKLNPSRVYLLHWGGMGSDRKKYEGLFLKGDTIIHLKKFSEKFGGGIIGYRLIFESKGKVDSVLEVDDTFNPLSKAIPQGDKLLKVIIFDASGQVTDEFVFNFKQATRLSNQPLNYQSLESRLRRYKLYDQNDRLNTVAAVWILSIGIDDYGSYKYATCKSDAQSYIDFFKKQYVQLIGTAETQTLFHEYILIDKDATKDAILAALKDIGRKAAFNDYFIFNFSGCSNVIKDDPVNAGTHFFPYDVVVTSQTAEKAGLQNRDSKDTSDAWKKCISLNILQEYIQAIPANNQLFISEAGPSEKFKTEFIKTLMQNSPEVASILNKNRIIIVPNGFGMDGVSCQGNAVQKGPINYFITSLDSTINIYNLFSDEFGANKVAFTIKNKAYYCQSFNYEYFDIFFERKFLRDYKEILNDGESQSRGVILKPKQLNKSANLEGKKYALVVGTDNYKGAGWKKLSNAIGDAKAIRDELQTGYGFEVQFLADKPMDTIYNAIREYYRILGPDDQFILYFAGHGDMETEFMDDGFIVCNDSKSREEDPVRNSYIQYVKLQKMINKIPARQILVMLDVCHGGIFNQKRSDPVSVLSNRNVVQFLVDQSQYTCRKFLSSVGAEAAFDGKAGDHSPFAKLLLQVLNARGKASNGIITLGNIYSVLQTASMNETATLKISPQKDGFGSDNPMSDFILIPVEQGE